MGRFPLRPWLVIGVLAAPTIALAVVRGGAFPGWEPFLLWLALLGLAELLPIAVRLGSQVTMTVPIHIALILLFPPWVAMAITAVGSLDVREFKREISLEDALFNRVQIVLAVGAAAAVVTSFPSMDIRLLPIVLAAIVHMIVNLGLVSIGISTEEGVPLQEVLRDLVPSPILGFFVSYGALSALGVVSAIAYNQVGQWSVAAILIPLLFARLSVLGARAKQEMSEKMQKQQESLLEATQRVFQEREDERHRIAEHIHDSSLQLLAAAIYGCENTITHMKSGRPDDATETVIVTRSAVEGAITSLRDSLVDLRRSSLEEGGLMDTVRKYTDQVANLWGVKVDLRGELQHEPPIAVSLGALQILQEGLINSVKHAKTDWVFVWITERGGMVHAVVEDRGEGFDPKEERTEEHVGLKLMSERAERLGGHLDISSQPGAGTRLELILPGGVKV